MNTNFLVVVVLLFLATVTLNAQATNKSEVAIRALIDQMTTAQSSYDKTSLSSIFTDDYIEISPAGEFDPREKVLSFYSRESKAAAAGVTVNVEEDFRSIRLYGDVAVVIAELSFLITRDGTTSPPRKMMLTAVCKKEKGNWKIASSQFTGVRPAGPMAPAPKPAVKPL